MHKSIFVFLLVVLLGGCSIPPETPMGELEVTIKPAEAGTDYFSVHLRSSSNTAYKMFYDTGSNVGTINAAAGTYDEMTIYASNEFVAEGVAHQAGNQALLMEDVEVEAGATRAITASFRPKTTVSFDTYTANIYSTAVITLNGVSSEEPLSLPELTASCSQGVGGASRLRTRLSAKDVHVGPSPKPIMLRYSSGWDYFVRGGVGCSFDGLDDQLRPIKLERSE